MKIKPLAFDSFGARSMCTLVETRDIKIVIDPSVALAPKRYGLPPHEMELRKKEELWSVIKREVKNADVVIVTHYHYDHHNPSEPEVMKGKVILVKHPKEKINMSQMKRAHYFLSLIEGDTIFADSKEFEFGNTRIVFSEPVPHGKDSKLGYVLEVLIEEDKKFLFTSDVEGFPLDEQSKFVIDSNPDVLFMDGPMTYMPHIYGKKLLEKSLKNVMNILESTDVKVIVMDHHLLRDLKWYNKIDEIINRAEEFNVEVKSAAKFRGIEENLLEAKRKELYQKSLR